MPDVHGDLPRLAERQRRVRRLRYVLQRIVRQRFRRKCLSVEAAEIKLLADNFRMMKTSGR